MSQVQYIGSGVVSGSIFGTVQTIGAVTGDIITVPLGVNPGTYLFKIDVVGFDAATPLGVAYSITAAARTTGIAATELPGESADELEEGALIACDNDFICVGNTGIVRLTGCAGKTINWTAVLTYTFGS
jgi:hypothetical protein